MESVANVKRFIEEFDNSFEFENVTILKYGLVNRYNLSANNGKVVTKNIAPSDYIENGEYAIYNDTYDICYFHRLDSTKVENGGGYGSSTGTKNTYKIDLIAWCKGNVGSQLDLYSVFATYLTDASAKIIEAKFDISKIEKEEFIVNTVNVESVLIKITYVVTFTENYCKTNCNFKKCN